MDVWESGEKIIDRVQVYVDARVLGVLHYLSKKYPNSEFSVLFKGKFEDGAYTVEPDYYIPKQEITSASVNYKEDLSIKRREGYIVIAHKHPGSLKTFSITDREFINKNFPVSLLWCNENFTDATAQINTDDLTVILPAEVYIIVDGNENISYKAIRKHIYRHLFTTESTDIGRDETADTTEKIKDEWDELTKYQYYYY